MLIKILKSLLSAIILSLAFGCYPGVMQKQTSKSAPSTFVLYSKAVQFKENDEYESAIAAIDSAILVNPRMAAYYYLKGDIYRAQNRFDLALDNYNKGLSLASFNPDVLEKIGLIHFRMKNYQEAIRQIKKAYFQKPQTARLLITLGEIYLEMDRPDMVQTYLQKYENQRAIISRQIRHRYLRLKGWIYFNEGEVTKGVDCFSQCLPSDVLSESEIKKLLASLFKLGKYNAAFSNINRLRPGQISEGNLYYFRALYYYYEHNYDDARTQFLLAIKNNTDEPEAYYYLGKIFEKLGKVQDASEMFRQYQILSEESGPHL